MLAHSHWLLAGTTRELPADSRRKTTQDRAVATKAAAVAAGVQEVTRCIVSICSSLSCPSRLYYEDQTCRCKFIVWALGFHHFQYLHSMIILNTQSCKIHHKIHHLQLSHVTPEFLNVSPCIRRIKQTHAPMQ